MKFINFWYRILIIFLLVICSVSIRLNYTDRVHAQGFPFPIPSLPINIGDFSNFDPSDIADFADDFIPGITDIIGGGTLPTNPTDLISQFDSSNPLNGILNGTDLLSIASQLASSQSPSDALPNLLATLVDAMPQNMLGTISTFDPNTGLWEIIGAVSGNSTYLNDFVSILSNNKYQISTNKTYPSSTGKSCLDPYTKTSKPDGTVISAYGGPLRCNNGKWESTLNIPPPIISTPTPTRPPVNNTVTQSPPPPPQSTITQSPPPPSTSNKGPGFCGCTCKADYKLCPNVPIFGAQCPDHVGQTCGEKLGALACGADADTSLWSYDAEATGGRNIGDNEVCDISYCQIAAPGFAQENFGSKGSLSFTLKGCSKACLTKADGSVSCE